MIAALLKHPRNHLLLADMVLGDVLDHQPGFRRQRSRAVSHTIAQRLGELRVIEDADPIGIEEPGHPFRVADHRHGPRDDHPVVARQHPGYPIVVALHQRLRHGVPHQMTLSVPELTTGLLVPARPA